MKVVIINGTHNEKEAVAGERRISWLKVLVIKIMRKFKELYPEAQVKEVRLQDYHIEHCRECMACIEPGTSCPRNKEPQDQQQEILSMMEEADVILFASPVYCMNVSGRMKVFLDRMTHYFFQPSMMGKIGGTIVSSGGIGKKETVDYLKKIVLTTGMQYAGTIDLELMHPDNQYVTEFVANVIAMYEGKKTYVPTKEDKEVFQAIRGRIKANPIGCAKNYDYWKEKNILESEYYY